MLFIIVAYLLGSIPFGFLTARKVAGIDIREHGSRNVGATNVFRVVGKRWGILVFLLDALKGYLAVRIPDAILDTPISIPFALILGIAALVGHSFPVWLSFRGGKGVATSLGVFLGIAFLPTIVTFGIWTFMFGISRIISLASLTAAVAFPFIVALTYWGQEDFVWLQIGRAHV